MLGLVCARILEIGGRAMMNKVYAALIMSFSVALTFASNQAFGQSGASHGGVSASTHSPILPSGTRHHNRRNGETFFPAAGGFFWGPSNGQPNVEVAQPIGPISGDINYTYKFDVPWDWAHRYPPSFFASPPVPVSPPVTYDRGCPAQTVTVSGANGKDQTVTIVRC
jgi:hypothetical protein